MKKKELHIRKFSDKHYPETNNASLIGKYCYPTDNSYVYEVRTGDEYSFAGWEKEKPFKVLIVSEPYKLEVTDHLLSFNPTHEYEFITVMYKRKCHVILNRVNIIEKKKK